MQTFEQKILATIREATCLLQYRLEDHCVRKYLDKIGYGPVSTSSVTLIDKKSAGEGEDDVEIYVVVCVTESDGNNRYFRIDGWYSSSDGTYIQGVYEVVPKTVTVVKFERKQ